MKLVKTCMLITIILLATACVEGKYSKMSDKELADKQRHCDSIAKKSAVFGNGCEKVSEEIERREKESK